MDRAKVKKQLHATRVTLQYHRTTNRQVRGNRDDKIAELESRVASLKRLYSDLAPEPVSLSHKSKYFIGPIRPRGSRGDGPTIICFRCECEKPREEFYSKGAVCKACIVKRSAQWAEKNPDGAKRSKNKYRIKNKDYLNSKSRKRYKINNQQERKRSSLYRANNKSKINAIARAYNKRRKRDPKYRALLTCKRRMWILFKSVGRKKSLRSAELLGIDRTGFFKHIESLFKPGMTWANRGKYGWHIDHIRPCSSFDMTDDDQARDCWHYTNLQPLWCHENWSKSDKYEVSSEKLVDDPKNLSVDRIATV